MKLAVNFDGDIKAKLTDVFSVAESTEKQIIIYKETGFERYTVIDTDKVRCTIDDIPINIVDLKIKYSEMTHYSIVTVDDDQLKALKGKSFSREV